MADGSQLKECTLQMVVRPPPSSREASLTKPLIDTKSITVIPLCPVIPDTLSVAMAPQTLNETRRKVSGWNLPVRCPKLRLNTPTSITWYLMKDEKEAKPARLFPLQRFYVAPWALVYREVCSW